MVIAAGKHPNGGSDVTPIFLAPSQYNFCPKKKELKLLISCDDYTSENLIAFRFDMFIYALQDPAYYEAY